MNRNRLFLLFCSILLGAVTIFFLALILSLFGQMKISPSLRPLSGDEIFFSVKLTLMTATLASLLALLISLPAAYLLARHTFPMKSAIETLLYLPLVLSPVALGAMLLVFFNTAPGRFFEAHLGRVVFETPGIVLAQFVVVVGLCLNVVKATFEQVNPLYEQIAMSLGATRRKAFFHVLLPLARRGILAAFFLTWARAVGEFGATVLLAGATPLKTETLPVAIYLRLSSADVHGACLFILISLGLSLGTLFLLRHLNGDDRSSLLTAGRLLP